MAVMLINTFAGGTKEQYRAGLAVPGTARLGSGEGFEKYQEVDPAWKPAVRGRFCPRHSKSSGQRPGLTRWENDTPSLENLSRLRNEAGDA